MIFDSGMPSVYRTILSNSSSFIVEDSNSTPSKTPINIEFVFNSTILPFFQYIYDSMARWYIPKFEL